MTVRDGISEVFFVVPFGEWSNGSKEGVLCSFRAGWMKIRRDSLTGLCHISHHPFRNESEKLFIGVAGTLRKPGGVV